MPQMFPRPWYRTSSAMTLPKSIADMSNWAGITFEMHWETCLNSRFPDSLFSHAGERILLFPIVIKLPVQDIHAHGIAINLIPFLARYFRNNAELLKPGKSTVDGGRT